MRDIRLTWAVGTAAGWSHVTGPVNTCRLDRSSVETEGLLLTLLNLERLSKIDSLFSIK